MGPPHDEAGRWANEGPQHRVQVGAIAVSEFEVTFDEWAATTV